MDKSNHEVPDKLIDQKSYYRGDFLSPEKFSNESWVWKMPDWKKIPGNFRNTFLHEVSFAAIQLTKN